MSFNIYSQSFSSIKGQEVFFGDEEVMQNIRLFEGDDFDSIDIQIFSVEPFLLSIIFELRENKESDSKIVYSDLYERLIEFKEDPDYFKLRKQQVALNKLEETIFLNTRWDTLTVLLRDIGMEEKEIESFKIYAQENSDLTTNMRYLVVKFYQKLEEAKSENKQKNKTQWEKLFLESMAIKEDSLLTLSRNEKKPVMLYFTGYNAVNCRRLEQSVLLDSQIVDILLNDFIFAPLYVDDRTALPQPEVKEANHSHNRNITLKTIGDKNSYYEYYRFENSVQPFFVILDSENNVIATADYNLKTKTDFINFLKSALDKFEKD